MKVYHQQTAELKDSDQNIEFIFGENSNCHEIVHACLQFHINIEKDVAFAADRVFLDGDVIR